MKFTALEEANSFCVVAEKKILEFKESMFLHILEQFQDIADEYDVVISCLYSTTVLDSDGNELDEGNEIHDHVWALINLYEDDLGLLGELIVEPHKNPRY